MKLIYVVLPFLAVYFFLNCNSQTKSFKSSNPVLEKKDTGIFIFGKIYDNRTKESINAYCEVKGTKINCRADESGNYKLDITRIAGTTRTYILNSSYINYGLSEIILTGKIKNSLSVDIELIDRYGTKTTTKINVPDILKSKSQKHQK